MTKRKARAQINGHELFLLGLTLHAVADCLQNVCLRGLPRCCCGGADCFTLLNVGLHHDAHQLLLMGGIVSALDF